MSASSVALANLIPKDVLKKGHRPDQIPIRPASLGYEKIERVSDACQVLFN
jgi:hypothetical protein